MSGFQMPKRRGTPSPSASFSGSSHPWESGANASSSPRRTSSVGVILRVISELRNDAAPAIVSPSDHSGSQVESASRPDTMASVIHIASRPQML